MDELDITSSETKATYREIQQYVMKQTGMMVSNLNIAQVRRKCGLEYVETIAKLIEMTNPKTIIPMHTECADKFSGVKEFAKYEDRAEVLHDGEKYRLE